MRKKIIAMVTALFTVATLSFPAAAETLVINIENDEFQAIVAAEGDKVSDNLVMAGGPSHGGPEISYEDSKGLKVSGRTASWQSVDLKFDNLEAGKTYRIEVFGTADSAEVFWINQADDPHGTFKTGDENGITWEFTLDADKKVDGQNRLRLNTSGTKDYYITGVKVYDVDGEAEAPAAEETDADAEDDEAAEEADVVAEDDTATEDAEEADADEEDDVVVEEEDDDAAAEETEEEADVEIEDTASDDVSEEETEEEVVVADTAADTATTGNTNAATTSTKASADTGIEGIAVIAGVALLATGAVVISRKRK